MRIYASRERQGDRRRLRPDAMRALLDHDWPGNVRELENAVERAVVLCPGGSIGLDLLPDNVLLARRAPTSPVRLPENGSTYKELVEEYERRLVRTALRRTGGVQKRAAELLRVKPTTLHEIIKRLEIRDGNLDGLDRGSGFEPAPPTTGPQLPSAFRLGPPRAPPRPAASSLRPSRRPAR